MTHMCTTGFRNDLHASLGASVHTKGLEVSTIMYSVTSSMHSFVLLSTVFVENLGVLETYPHYHAPL